MQRMKGKLSRLVHVEARGNRAAFTLIELLIVVAIIAILAAIAVPNFLEAQVRSKNARAKSDMRNIIVAIQSYAVDNNKYPYHTYAPPIRDIGMWSWYNDFPGQTPDTPFKATDPAFYALFYSMQQWARITTPLAYMTSVPFQAYSRNVPYGYDRFEEWEGGQIAYIGVFCSGPDMDNGDWERSSNPETVNSQYPYGCAVGYDASNGTKSNGDGWRIIDLGLKTGDPAQGAHEHFPGEMGG
jgi:prepilin-type N-terminal cleavage/methylation domain-containing protein